MRGPMNQDDHYVTRVILADAEPNQLSQNRPMPMRVLKEKVCQN